MTLQHFFRAKEGDILFHYTSVEAALAIISNQTFWLSEYLKTNDSSEYVYAREQYVNAYKNRQVWVDDTVRFTATGALVGSEFNKVMFLGCTTEASDDLNQWRAYGDNGKGCVIGIDADFLERHAGVTLRKVVYSTDELESFVNAGLIMLQTKYEENPDDSAQLRQLAFFFIADLFVFKNPAFASEQEIRITRMLCVDDSAPNGIRDPGGHDEWENNLPSLPVKMRHGVFGATRYVELPLRFSNGQTAIRSVGFGPANSATDRAKIERTAATLAPLVRIWKSNIPYRIA